MTLIISDSESFESKIYLIRGEKVMLDFDLAELYQVPTKQLTQQVKRHLYRFPSDFMFNLSYQELTNLRSQFVTSSSSWGGRRYPPMAFTEHGIAMLSSILNSRRAIEVNIAIIKTFVGLRKVIKSDRLIEKQIAELERKCDGKFKVVFDTLREIMSTHAVPRKRIIGIGGPDGTRNTESE